MAKPRLVFVLGFLFAVGCSWFGKKSVMGPEAQETAPNPAIDECVKSDRKFFEFFASTGTQAFTKDEKFLRDACMEGRTGQHGKSVFALKDAILRRLRSPIAKRNRARAFFRDLRS